MCDNGVSAADTLPLASDLAAAWTAVVSTGQQAVALERVEKRLPLEARLSMGQWLTDTDQRVENLRAMPDKAQRACSQAYLYLGQHAVAQSIPASEPIRRAVFLAVQGVMPARWINAIPWDMKGRFNVSCPRHESTDVHTSVEPIGVRTESEICQLRPEAVV